MPYHKLIATSLFTFIAATTMAWADPFDWESATRAEGVLIFETQPAATFILGYVNQGYVLDYSVVLIGSQDQETVLVDKSTSQAIPRVQALGDLIVVESIFEPWGHEGLITVRQCWSFDPQLIAWLEGKCLEYASP